MKERWFCIDLRRLNAQTIKDSHGLPQIEETLDCLNGAEWFTSLNLKSGYWQVEMEEDSRASSSYFFLFLANSYFLLFFSKIPIFSYFSTNLQLNFSFQGFFQILFFSVWQHMY